MGKKGQGHKPKHDVRNHKTKPSNEDILLHDTIDQLLLLCTTQQHPTSSTKALQYLTELTTLTDKIKKLQINDEQPDPVDKMTCGASIDKLMQWATENGAHLNGCSIEAFQGYNLGIKADIDIPQSALVIAVPKKLMLTTETANQSILKDLIARDEILKNMPNVALSILLLTEKFRENSFWQPYLDVLPKEYNTVLYFTVEELEELKGSPTLDMALKQIKSIARQYAYFHKLFNSTNNVVSQLMRKQFTYKEYCWAVSTVMTRLNTVPSDDGSQMINALIPLWDLCNHANGEISTAFNPELQRSECLALRDFKAGEQFFIFYGERSNADLFIHNGFVYEENDHDVYCIRLGISKSDCLREKREELLRKLSVPSSRDFFLRKNSKPVDDQLLAFLRVFNMDEEQLQQWLESDKPDKLHRLDYVPDSGLEKKCWSFLEARLKLLLSTYPTSLDEDNKLLTVVSGISPNKLLAIKMRMTEKKIIQNVVHYCSGQ